MGWLPLPLDSVATVLHTAHDAAQCSRLVVQDVVLVAGTSATHRTLVGPAPVSQDRPPTKRCLSPSSSLFYYTSHSIFCAAFTFFSPSSPSLHSWVHLCRSLLCIHTRFYPPLAFSLLIAARLHAHRLHFLFSTHKNSSARSFTYRFRHPLSFFPPLFVLTHHQYPAGPCVHFLL